MSASGGEKKETRLRISDTTIGIIKLCAIIITFYFGLAFLVFVVESGTEGASINSYPQALWYTLVTLSTVGYGDLYPVSALGRVAGGVVILCSVGLIGYTVGKLGDQLIENNRRKFLGMNGTKFTGHYIIVGWNEVSRIVINELLSAGFNVALLTDEEKDITEIRSTFDEERRLFVSFGLLESESSYRKLNIDDAIGAILLCENDTRTLIIVLHLREMCPGLKITAYIQNSQLRKTVENAGVSYVVSPNEVIGRMIASATFEPDVSHFLEDILSTTTADDDLDIQEYQLSEGHELVGRTFRDAVGTILERTKARLLTYSRSVNGKWEISKSNDDGQTLRADDYLIVLTNFDSATRLSGYLGVKQGRKV